MEITRDSKGIQEIVADSQPQEIETMSYAPLVKQSHKLRNAAIAASIFATTAIIAGYAIKSYIENHVLDGVGAGLRLGPL